jgi:hypothetical protein
MYDRRIHRGNTYASPVLPSVCGSILTDPARTTRSIPDASPTNAETPLKGKTKG